MKLLIKKLKKENIEELFKDVDIIVEAFDNPEYKAMLVNEVLTKFKYKKWYQLQVWWVLFKQYNTKKKVK